MGLISTPDFSTRARAWANSSVGFVFMVSRRFFPWLSFYFSSSIKSVFKKLFDFSRRWLWRGVGFPAIFQPGRIRPGVIGIVFGAIDHWASALAATIRDVRNRIIMAVATIRHE
jgi:hypothetical protein